jgi:hypothetical protein
VVAKFLGLKPTRFLPLWAARGLTNIPEGHSFRNRFLQFIGKGISFRLVPMDDKTIYFSAVQSRLPKGTISSRPDRQYIFFLECRSAYIKFHMTETDNTEVAHSTIFRNSFPMSLDFRVRRQQGPRPRQAGGSAGNAGMP